jgi:ABC-2 type transport system permease protein
VVSGSGGLRTSDSGLRTPEGRIYDLGYQQYTGPRQGRGRAVVSLFRFSLRRAWAIGRPFRSKIIPWGLAAMALVPALVGLGAAAMVSRFNLGDGESFELFSYQGYYGYISTLFVLFCTSVAPELVCPDQRQRVLTLYFSRYVGRTGYVAAKLGAMLAAMLAFALTPQIILFFGNALASRDSWGYIQDKADVLPRIVAAALLVSLFFGSISLAIAAHTGRRIYAAGAFFALMVLSNAVAASIHLALDNDTSRYLSLLAIYEVPLAAVQWIFGREGGGALAGEVAIRQELWFLAAVAYTLIALLAMAWRYVRLSP